MRTERGLLVRLVCTVSFHRTVVAVTYGHLLRTVAATLFSGSVPQASQRRRARFSVAPCDRKAQKIPSTTVIGGNLPAEVLKILDKGPKYSYEPAPSRHQYLAMVRDVANRAEEDNPRNVDVYRRGGDLNQLAEALGINIKTARSIAATDRQKSLRGGASKKSLEMTSYSVKLVTQRPADRNRNRDSRKLYAQWLQSDGPRVCRFYLDETNYNIWCYRNFGRAAKGQPAVHTTTTTKGANLNTMACIEEPNTEAVFIFDGAAHAREEQAALANSMHSINRLPAYSPFFNPIEKVFSKFKSHLKAYLSERPDLALATPQGYDEKRAQAFFAAGRSSALHAADTARGLRGL
ncbi:hypothetical protein HPB52_024536 [Rhipicephalus sanguineus]|uniref:Tc1-like transposase DDE domain-containing protein n=1 Tax=Rhipicephalus sanguineus TaxID=34632 RepID=A0A9D4SMF0_RHISA|nr:hypothetical protein HPB52_024536 [Rhipicephalus sanguineus]